MSTILHEDLVKELQNEILSQRVEELPSSLLEDGKKILFWEFLNKISVKDRRNFCRMLDVDDGVGGWENFLEEMGLNKWEDRMYCRKYPGQMGPTEKGLELLMEAGTIRRETVAEVLELLKDMNRYDILTNINWSSLLCICKKLEGLDVINFKTDTKFKEFIPCNPPDKVISNESSHSEHISVFIIYANDAEEEATKVAWRFRNHWNYRVLIVTEPQTQAELLSDPSNAIHKWFLEVDFIIPILSPTLLRQTQMLERSNEAIFNRYLYTLIQHQFVFDYGSKNKRCRPFCPNRFAFEVKRNPVMNGNGLLKMYLDTTEKGIDEQAALLPLLIPK